MFENASCSHVNVFTVFSMILNGYGTQPWRNGCLRRLFSLLGPAKAAGAEASCNPGTCNLALKASWRCLFDKQKLRSSGNLWNFAR